MVCSMDCIMLSLTSLQAPFLAAVFLAKAFIVPAFRGFIQALRADLSNTNTKVQEAVLEEADSEYFKNNPQSIERVRPLPLFGKGSFHQIPSIGKLAGQLTVEQAAGGVIKAIQSGEENFCWPRMISAFMWFNTWCPSLLAFLSIKSGWQYHPNKASSSVKHQ